MSKTILTLVRYIALFFIIINTLAYCDVNSNLVILLLFIIIVNSQLRFFTFKHNQKLSILSLLLDIVLVLILSSLIKSITIFYFVPIILDISFFISRSYKYVLLTFILIAFTLLNIEISIFYAIENTCILLLIALLFIYIYNESINTVRYQSTYDKLRISEDKLRKSNSELEVYINSVEEISKLKERNRISREIHDSVGHALSTTIIQLGAIERLLKDNPGVASIVHELRDFVNDSFKEVRNAVSELKPTEYENYQNLFKLNELVKNFAKLTGTEVKLTISKSTWSLSDTQSVVLYRVIQEALSNALRHGQASKVDIFITFSPTQLILTIKDNGLGCNVIKKGTGLNSIYERLDELNGSVDFNNSSDGFVIQASFPKNVRGDFIE